MPELHDVIETRTGHVVLRAVALAAALSAAQTYNEAVRPLWPYRVFPTGSYAPALGGPER